MNNSIKQVAAYTYVGDFGQTVYEFAVECAGAVPVAQATDFRIEGGRKDISGKVPPSGITGVRTEKNTLFLEVDPFVYRSEFSVIGSGSAEAIHFSRADIAHTFTKTADEFSAHSEGGVLFRLFTPEAIGPRPLILFLHGGGECGYDNNDQLMGTMGAANLAERFPDMFIMAPQAPGEHFGSVDFSQLMKMGNPFDMSIGKRPQSGKTDRGWNRDYLAKVCMVIRGMIEQGKVDGRRVYVIGMSMGGGGTLRILSVDPELFAAAAPICPSMNGETFSIFKNLTTTAVWVSTAYIDHQPGRHAYIAQACQKLMDDGLIEVHMSIFTPDELAAYGIGYRNDLSHNELLAENHNSWTLTLHNEHGILDWLTSVVKETEY